MSGGAMDYVYSKLEMDIPTRRYINESSGTPETKELAYECVKKLEEAVIIAKRLEWWLSGDDGEESFKRRLEEELGYDILKSKKDEKS